MTDPDRTKKLKEKVARLEEQLTRSEKMLGDIQKQIKASRASEKKEDDEKVAQLTKDLEEQRLEFEGLVGRMHEEIQSVQRERDELASRIEKPPPKKRRATFEDEPTSTYTHKHMKNVVKREMLVAEEEPFFEDEEVTDSHVLGQTPENKDRKT